MVTCCIEVHGIRPDLTDVIGPLFVALILLRDHALFDGAQVHGLRDYLQVIRHPCVVHRTATDMSTTTPGTVLQCTPTKRLEEIDTCAGGPR